MASKLWWVLTDQQCVQKMVSSWHPTLTLPCLCTTVKPHQKKTAEHSRAYSLLSVIPWGIYPPSFSLVKWSHLFLSASSLCVLGAALKRAGTGGQPQHLFLAQGTTSLLASQGPALTQLWTGRQAGGDTGRICRRRWCREPVSGERHCMLTAREPAEQSHLDWTQLHAAAISSHLLFCMGAITFAQDTTAIFPDVHRHIWVWTQSPACHWEVLAQDRGREHGCPALNSVSLANVDATALVSPAQWSYVYPAMLCCLCKSDPDERSLIIFPLSLIDSSRMKNSKLLSSPSGKMKPLKSSTTQAAGTLVLNEQLIFPC